MKTITKEYKVYTLDELSEEAREKAHADYLRGGDYWGWEGEALGTMKAIEELFHIRLDNWDLNTYRPEYPDIRFYGSFWDYQPERLELKGNRARAFLWNNFGEVLLNKRTNYYCRFNGKLVPMVGTDSVKRTSRIFTTRVYNGTCPLTGICFDNDALDPLAYFCFGVEWDPAKNARVPSSRSLWRDNVVTVEEVIRDCVHSMFTSFLKDIEDAESDEAFAETSAANGWTYLENGEMFNI